MLSSQAKLLKYENLKLKRQLIFTLPAGKETCGRECPGCYAMKAQRIYHHSSVPYRDDRLQASQQPDFVERITKELRECKKPIEAVRINESGDFYSQDFIDKWEQIAKQNPSTKFYAFTKRKREFNFSKLEQTSNVSIIDSLKHGGLNYGAEEEVKQLAKQHGTIVCPATLNKSDKCGITCNYCFTKEAQDKGVYFVQH